MTPMELLKQRDFDQPLIISPDHFQSFESLYKYRDLIRDLRLVAIKDDQMYKKYHETDRSEHSKNIRRLMKGYNIIITDDQFPNWLSGDIRQRLIWIKPKIKNTQVVEFISQTLQREEINEFILFERPNNSVTKLIKGSVPTIRHVHLWTKKHE